MVHCMLEACLANLYSLGQFEVKVNVTEHEEERWSVLAGSCAAACDNSMLTEGASGL